MKLVADNTSNVAPLPVDNLQNVAGMFRALADRIDKGDFGEVLRAITIVQETNSALSTLIYGENATTFEAMGVLDASKFGLFADHLIED